MKKFLISIMCLIITGLVQPVFATQLPMEIKNYIIQNDSEATIRFDGLITLKDGTLYLPLLPAYNVKDADFGIKYTYPEKKTFAQKPDIVVFSNNYSLLKLIKTKEGLSVTSLKEMPVEIRTGLLPQDLLVPKGLVLPDSLIGILGNLSIPLTSNLKITAKQQIPQIIKEEEDLPQVPKVVKVIPQLKNKQFFITNFNSNYIYIMPSDLTDVQYTLKLDSIPKSVKEINEKYLLVATSGKTYIDVVDIRNEEIAKQIDLGVVPDEIIITKDEKTAYVVSSRSSNLFVINIPTMSLVKQIQIKGRPEKIAFSDDEEKIVYQDLRSNNIYSVELKNNYVNIYQGNVPNVSKLAILNDNVYALVRTRNLMKVLPYQEYIVPKNDKEERIFSSKKSHYVKSAFFASGPVAKNIKEEKQKAQEEVELKKNIKEEDGLNIELSAKPVDMLLVNNKFFILSAVMNSIDIFNPETNEVEKTIPLKIAGFSTKFNKIKNSNMAIITNVLEKKYVVFDLENQKVLQINPIDVPISTITVLNQTEYSVDKTVNPSKNATENL